MDTIHKRQTDRQADGHRATAKTALTQCIASRGNKMHSEAAFAYSIGLYMYKTRHDAWLLQTLYQLTANLRTVRTAIIIAYLYVRDITAQGCSSRHGIGCSAKDVSAFVVPTVRCLLVRTRSLSTGPAVYTANVQSARNTVWVLSHGRLSLLYIA